jgi:hypothetical protein
MLDCEKEIVEKGNKAFNDLLLVIKENEEKDVKVFNGFDKEKTYYFEESCEVETFLSIVNGYNFHDIVNVVFYAFNNDIEFKHLIFLPKSVKGLYLGHDGVCDGSYEDVEMVINALPKLREIHYCGYYADYSSYIKKICDKYGVKSVEIY